jgi:hypothetical protein
MLLLGISPKVATASADERRRHQGGIDQRGRTTAVFIDEVASDLVARQWRSNATTSKSWRVRTCEGTEIRSSASATATSAVLSGLKSQTTYAVSVVSCANQLCSPSSASDAVAAETDREHLAAPMDPATR